MPRRDGGEDADLAVVPDHPGPRPAAPLDAAGASTPGVRPTTTRTRTRRRRPGCSPPRTPRRSCAHPTRRGPPPTTRSSPTSRWSPRPRQTQPPHRPATLPRSGSTLAEVFHRAVDPAGPCRPRGRRRGGLPPSVPPQRDGEPRKSRNEGTSRATTPSRPRDDAAGHHRHGDDAALANAPARRSPSRGPPATTTMNTPCIRPRISSGAAPAASTCAGPRSPCRPHRRAPGRARPATATAPARTR